MLCRRLLLVLVACIGWSIVAMPLHAADAPVLLVVGDSISAGYGLPAGAGWVTLLAERLKREGYAYQVVNASISGDTTAGGRARLPALLPRYKPRIVILELGGNDALRGGNLDVTRANLDAMVTDAQKAGARPMLLGMQLPPNYGSAYVNRFGALFGEVAKAHRIPAVPFLFQGFAEDLTQFQADRIHPVAAAQPRILANVWPVLQPLLGK
ncbi:MAG TPA: arylesterase [Casimicrobiaceae bacterium]|jgi:acyl-CoA thioesterase I|nr:arylesterase [Casimicrobiaceae bacterium]